MGGFLSGTFWGAIVGAGALFVSSLALERQELSLPQPSASEVEVPGGSEFDQARPETDPVLPTTETRPEADPIESVEAPDDAVDEPPALDTAALDVPEPTLEAPDTLGDAPEPAADDVPDVATETAVQEAPQDELETPEAPANAPDTQTIEPVEPEAETDQSNDAGDVAVPDADTREANPEEPQIAALPEAATEEIQPDTQELPFIASPGDAPSMSQPEVSEDSALPGSTGGTDAAAIGESPEAPSLPQVIETPSLPEGNGSAPEISEPSEPSTGLQITPGAESIRVDDGPSFLEPVEEIEDRAAGVETNRLPQAGESSLPTVRRVGVDEPEVDTAEPAGEGDGFAAEDADIADGPALQRFASAFENPQGTPIVSVVLVHEGGTVPTSDVLNGLPPHVSFAVDAGGPNAIRIAQAYRAAEREVVLMPSLPAGATPQDVEQAMQVNLDAIPEAVAIMDVTGSSFQSDRTAVQQIVDVMADTGHGMITFPRGLNTAHQEAQRSNVPTGLIFRNIDGDGETQEQIRRALDRAAFRARQNDGVILVGTTSGTTLAAIVEWALGNRSASVTIAPVSAALSTDG